MKRIILFLSLIFLIANYTIAQAPGIKWQKCVGGSGDDGEDGNIKLIEKNGNIIVAGSTHSSNGDIDSTHGQSDVFVGEMDNTGNWIWKKSYGGTSNDFLNSIIDANDGGYILLCHTYSDDGDVVGFHDGQGGDKWLIHINQIGDILWSKCIGGTYGESSFGQIISVANKSYAIISGSASTDGDVSGIPSHNPINYPYSYDIWLIKIDNYGNRIWDKCFGTTYEDWGVDIINTTDNGFYIQGNMGTSNFDGTGGHGMYDGWFAKIDSLGNLIWSNIFGGKDQDYFSSFSIDHDNNIVLAGYTYSNDEYILGNHGGVDAWIIKIDANGNVLWQKCLGGSGDDSVFDIEIDKETNYLICGSSTSADGDVSFNHGWDDGWVISLSKDGDLKWQKSFGGSQTDIFSFIKSVSENYLLAAGFTISNDQEVSGNHGDVDIWLVKLGIVNTITGYAYYDLNSNNIKDINESLFSNGKIIIKSTSDSLVGITSNGNFAMDVDTGTFNSSFIPNSSYHNSVSASQTSTFSTYNLMDTILFAMQPIAGKKDVQAFAFPMNVTRPGFDVSYKITYKNTGTTDFANGTIQFIKDARLNLNSSTPNYASVNGDTIKWNYTNLKAADTGSIFVNFTLAAPPVANIGDTLRSYLSMDITGDLTPDNNRDTLSQIVQGSYDPNDKSENHAGAISKNNLANGDWLTYTIRFQNTGTDTAFNIIVRDTLDSKLDWNSLEMITASHTYQLNITDGNNCAWHFNSILLPDSTVNEDASHGYIVYRIKPKSTLVAGDIINNTASIYFDYNLPVLTNTEKTTVVNDLVLPLNLTAFSAKRTGKTNLLQWSTTQELNTDHFEIQRSNNSRDFISIGTVKSFNNGKSQNDYTYTDQLPLKATNYYRLKMIDKDSKFTYSAIRNVNNTGSLDVSIYPNPVNDVLSLNFNTEKVADVQIDITDINGKKLQTKKVQLPYGASIQTLNVAALSKGTYFVQCTTKDGNIGIKFVKQ